jgi:hypothetical protein
MYDSLRLSPKTTKVANPLCRVLRVVHGVYPGHQGVAWGIDPGIYFGMTVIENEKVYVFSGSLLQVERPGHAGLLAYQFLRNMTSTFKHKNAQLIVEGAAYGKPFRQVQLAEIRQGFYLAGATSMYFAETKIVPPATIRKHVFGQGQVQAADVWPLLNHNAADSLAIALYATLEKGD